MKASDETRALIAQKQRTLVDIVQEHAACKPDKVAYTFLSDGEAEGNLTFAELDRKARVIATSLHAHAKPGDRALLMYPAGLEYVAAFFGCLYAGIIAVPAYPPRGNGNFARLLSIVQDAGATFVLAADDAIQQLRAKPADSSAFEKLLWIDSREMNSPATGGVESFVTPDLGADNIAFLQYTSGSTAAPKGVMVTHGNLMHNEKCLAEAFGHSEDSVFLMWLPIHHDMGLIGGILGAAYCGTRCIFMAPAAFLQQPLRWFRALSKYKATFSAAPNFAFDLSTRRIDPGLEDIDLSRLHAIANGSEPVRARSIADFEAAFASYGLKRRVIRPAYGLAESTLMVSTGFAEGPASRSFDSDALEQGRVQETAGGENSRALVSCGEIVYHRVAIVDPETLNSCRDGQVGEIWVSSPSVAAGYWDKPEATEAMFRARIAETNEGPFMRTGDLGFVHDEQLFITGRIKDLIILHGRNLYPHDIELTTEQSHPALRPSCGAAFSIEVDGLERLVIACEIERSRVRNVDVEEVVSCVRETVAMQLEAEVYAVVLLKPGAIPKTSSGKIQRSLCRKKYLAGELEVLKRSPGRPAVDDAQQPGGSRGAATKNGPVEFSLFYFSSNETKFEQQKYRLFLEGARFADEHGFASVWVPERHFHAFGGIYPNPSVLASALAVSTRHIRIRAGSVVLPLHNPIRVAEEWAVVDNLSGGRVDLAFARGWNPNDFVLSPSNYANSLQVLYRDLDIVRKLWRGESIVVANGKGADTPVRIYPLPEQPELPVWITCSGGQERFVEAGEGGWNILTALLFQSPEELGRKIAAYREARARRGHNPDTGHVTLMLHTFLGSDERDVKEAVREPFIDYLKSSIDLWQNNSADLNSLSEVERKRVLDFAFERYYRTSGLFGTPESCQAMVKNLWRVGVNEIACLIDFGVETEAVLKGLESLNELKEKVCGRSRSGDRPIGSFAARREAQLEKPFVAAVSVAAGPAPAHPPSQSVESSAEPPRRVADPAALEAWIKQVIARGIAAVTEAKSHEIDYQKNFFGLGINSLKAIEIIDHIQRVLELKLSPTLLFEFPTIAQLAAALVQRHGTHLSQRMCDGPTAKEPMRPADSGDDSCVRRDGHSTPVVQDRKLQSGDIAIIGMACRFPGAPDLSSFWKLLAEGRDAVTEVPADHWNWRSYYDSNPEADNKTYSRWGGFLDNIDLFDAAFFNISPREARLIDPQQRIMLETAWQAFEHSGYPPDGLVDLQVGVFVGASYNGYYQRIQPGLKRSDHAAATGNHNAIIANRLSFFLNLHGPSVLVDTLCSSSLVAVHLACQSLRTGECSVALAGGVNILLSPENFVAMSRMRGHSPDGRCKAFDHRANGICFGEGAGALVLKPLDRALEDGDTVHGVIKGSAINHGGQTNGLIAPNPQAQARLVRQALRVAGISAETIGYVEAHGTGTSLGDPIEVEGLTQAFRDFTSKNQFCAIGSVKTNIGHLESAAGMAGIMKVLLSMQNRQLPATLHFEKANPLISFETSPFRVQSELTEWKSESLRRAGVSSFGIGGSNAHVLLEEAQPPIGAEVGFERAGLFTLSAKTPTALTALATRYQTFLSSNPDLSLSDLCFTQTSGRAHFPHRLAAVAKDRPSLEAGLAAFVAGQTPGGMCLGNPKENEKVRVAFLFTGQGSLYSGMGRQLYEDNSVFRAALDRCDALLQDSVKPSLTSLLFSDQAKDQLTNALFAQTALFAIEYALTEMWKEWGVVPDVVMGHSLGEYAAAVAAGSLSFEDGLQLVAERARLIERHASRGGAMATICASFEVVNELVAARGDDVAIAAINSPNHTVVSGHKAAIQNIVDGCKGKGIATQLLKVTHAFHSPLLDPVLAPFENAARRFRFEPSRVPVVSNLTGNIMPSGEVQDAVHWRRQMREPVAFVAGIQSLSKYGCGVFVEVGPGASLLGMSKRILGKQATAALLPSLTGNNEWDSLLHSLGELYVRGIPVNWKGFNADRKGRRIPLPTYPFERQRFWVDVAEPVSQALRSPERNGNDLQVSPTRSERAPQVPAPPLSQNQAPKRRDQLIRLLRSSMAKSLEMSESDVDINKSFVELGSDSLVLIEAIQAIQQMFDVKLSTRQLFEELTNLNKVAEYIDQRLPDSARFEGWPLSETTTVQANSAGSSVTRETSGSGRDLETPAGSAVPSDANWVNQRQSALETIVSQQLAAMNQLMRQQLEAATRHFENGAPSVKPSTTASAMHPPQEVRPAAAPQSRTLTFAPSAGDRMDATLAAAQPWVPYQPLNPGSLEDLSSSQQEYLKQFIAAYSARTSKSKESAQRYRSHHADLRASMSFRLSSKEIRYPIVGARSQGSQLWDLDGNQYVDYTMGFGVNLFGHNPPFVTEAVERQLEKGIHLGPQSELAGEVASLFCEMTGMERATFCNSGTEAVMAALRVARVTTGRSKIAICAGSYHGTSDGVMVTTQIVDGELKPVPLVPGVPPGMVEELVVLNYGSARSVEILKARIYEFAAVLVEPVQSRRPDLQPVDFLRQVRKITEDAGVLLIFDEVITGFRVHAKGAQGWFGIQADLATYGKIVGGGFPIGVLAGKAACMDSIDGGMWHFGDDSVPAAKTTLYTGTFCKHPLAMAAAKAVLLEMRRQGQALFEELNSRTEELAGRLNRVFEKGHAPIQVVRFGSLFRLGGPLQLMSTDALDLLYYHLIHNGVYVWEGRNWFISTEHSTGQLDSLVDTMDVVVKQLQESEFLPAPSQSTSARETEVTVSGRTSATNGHKTLDRKTLPITDAQRELLLLSRGSETASLSYNQSVAIRLHGLFSIAALEGALNEVAARHEALRTVFPAGEESQEVLSSYTVPIQHIDFSEKTVAVQNRAMEQWMAEEAQVPFPLETAPLWRVTVIRRAQDDHLLALTIHHVIADGWSIGVLLHEISALYSAKVEDRTCPLQEPAGILDYVDFLRQEATEPQMEIAEKFWLEELKAVSPFELPLDYPRSIARFGNRLSRTLDPALASQLTAVNGQMGSTSFMTLLASYLVFLNRLTGRQELAVVVPVANQLRMKNSCLIGDCSNLMVISVCISPDSTFATCVQRVKKTLLECDDHQAYPFARLLRRLKPKRDPGRWPFFNVDRPVRMPRFSRLVGEDVPFPIRYTNFDFGLNVTVWDGNIDLAFDYKAALFNSETLERWSRQFTELLQQVLTNPEVVISNLPSYRSAASSLEGESQHLEALYMAPGSPAEQLLADIWAEVLDVERVSVVADFFEMGGHSLLATQILSRIRERFGVEVRLDALFQHSSIASMAEYLESGRFGKETEQDAIAPASRSEGLPLSFTQRRLWFIEQLDPGNTAYNMVGALHLKGSLNLQALQESLNAIVRRHESLRTDFRLVDGEPTLCIHPALAATVEYADLSLDGRLASVDGVIKEQSRQLARQTLHLSQAPLFRTRLLKLADDDYAFLVTIHHIVSDGWSMGVLLKELSSLYRSYVLGEASTLPELPVQFADYAAWQRQKLQGAVLESQIDWWAGELRGVPPFLNLPTDRRRVEKPGFRGEHLPFALSMELSERVRHFARQEGATAFMVWLAGFSIVLSRYSGQDDFIVGTDIANRTRVETENLIGCLVNLLPLRMNLTGDPEVREFLKSVRKHALGAYAHQDVPFDELVRAVRPERTFTSTPLVQALCVLQNAPLSVEQTPGLTIDVVPIEMETAEFELILSVEDSQGAFFGTLGFSADLFDRARIEGMLSQLKTVLEQMIENPEQRLSSLSILPGNEQAQHVAASAAVQLSQKDLDKLLLRLSPSAKPSGASSDPSRR